MEHKGAPRAMDTVEMWIHMPYEAFRMFLQESAQVVTPGATCEVINPYLAAFPPERRFASCMSRLPRRGARQDSTPRSATLFRSEITVVPIAHEQNSTSGPVPRDEREQKQIPDVYDAPTPSFRPTKTLPDPRDGPAHLSDKTPTTPL